MRLSLPANKADDTNNALPQDLAGAPRWPKSSQQMWVMMKLGYHEKNVDADASHCPRDKRSRVPYVALSYVKYCVIGNDKPSRNCTQRLKK